MPKMTSSMVIWCSSMNTQVWLGPGTTRLEIFRRVSGSIVEPGVADDVAVEKLRRRKTTSPKDCGLVSHGRFVCRAAINARRIYILVKHTGFDACGVGVELRVAHHPWHVSVHYNIDLIQSDLARNVWRKAVVVVVDVGQPGELKLLEIAEARSGLGRGLGAY